MIPIHPVLDGLLNGGLHPGIITTVYGPAGSGKTNIAVLAAVAVSRLGKKTVYIDTEGGFSIERVKQIANDSPDIIKHILFLRPTTFTEQKKAVEGLANIDGKVGLIIVDSISMLYRLEMGGDDVFDVNRALGKQLAGLISIAAKRSIPILLTDESGETRAMGVVNVTDRVVDRPFADIEVEFVFHLARQAAYAITGAALFRSKGRAKK